MGLTLDKARSCVYAYYRHEKETTLQQLQINQISDTTRLGRMLAAGRLTATMRSKATGNHITLSFSAKTKGQDGWKTVPFFEATHVFIQQGQGGWGTPKVGTFYPTSGKLYTEKGFDSAAWLYAITNTLRAAETGVLDTEQFDIQEADRCGRCGKQLTDPVSIARGIGPTCADEETGSQHYHKGLEREFEPAPPPGSKPPVAPNLNFPFPEEPWLMDKKGRTLPKTFDELAAAVR